MKKIITSLFVWFFVAGSCFVSAQPAFTGLERLLAVPESYVAGFVSESPVIDGDIGDTVWEQAAWSGYFRDIEGDRKPQPRYQTRIKMLWSEDALFVAAELSEPHIWANLKKHDAIVFHDNDFEVFIDPYNTAHTYFEIEVNAYNTIFDLFMSKPYRSGSDALVSWDTPGLKTAVKINGTLNDASDEDQSWTVEMKIPFSAIRIGYGVHAPQNGTLWRINFSRVEWDVDVVDGKYTKGKDAAGNPLPEYNWVWSPQGVINMHCPETWGYLLFSDKHPGEELPAFELPYQEEQRRYLWLVYHRQKYFAGEHRRYAHDLEELGITPEQFIIKGKENVLKLTATDYQFTATIEEEGKAAVSITEEGLVKVVNQ